jgi:hypothetical protein
MLAATTRSKLGTVQDNRQQLATEAAAIEKAMDEERAKAWEQSLAR